MSKINSIPTKTYVSPSLSCDQTEPVKVLCVSPFGEEGGAGRTFGPGNTNDYSEDLL